MANEKEPVSQVLGIGQIEPEVSGSSRINVGQTERILSAVGGSLLLSYGLRKGTLGGLLLAAAGGSLIYRGASGYCSINKALGRNTAQPGEGTGAIEISKSMTINKPRAEVYAYWRQLENLPKFMFHLKEVKQYDPKHSHWVAQIADGKLAKALGTVEWDAQVVEEVQNERLVWKSVEGASIDNAGEVRFIDAPGNRGTEVHATIQYRPPAGQLGSAVMKLFNPAFKEMIKQDLRRFKQLMETGEIATIAGQSSGRKAEPDTSGQPSPPNAPIDEKHESLML